MRPCSSSSGASELEGRRALEQHPQKGALWRYRGCVRSRAGALGALRGHFVLHLGDGPPRRGLLLADVWLGEHALDGWSPRVVLGGDEPRRSRVELLGFEVRAASWEPLADDASWPASFELEGSASVLLELAGGRDRDAAAPRGPEPRAHRRLLLETDRGTIFLTVVLGDLPLPEELLPPAQLSR